MNFQCKDFLKIFLLNRSTVEFALLSINKQNACADFSNKSVFFIQELTLF